MKTRWLVPLARPGARILAALTLTAAVLVLPAAAQAAGPAPTTVNFGNVLVGTTSVSLSAPFTIDSGNTLSSISIGGSGIANSAYNVGDTCFSIANGPSSCSLQATFTPSTTGPSSLEEIVQECPAVGVKGFCHNVADITFTGTGVTAVPAGTLTAAPGSAAPGSTVAVSSVTPCPLGTTSVPITLYDWTGTAVTSLNATLVDASGDWTGTMTIPTGAANGSYFIGAQCTNGND